MIPPPISEVDAIVVMPRDGLTREHGLSFVIMKDLVLASRNTIGVLERIIGVPWVMGPGVITTNGGLGAIP